MAKKKTTKKKNPDLPYVASIGGLTKKDLDAAMETGWRPDVEGHDDSVTHECPVPGCCKKVTHPRNAKVTHYICPEHRKSAYAFILHNRHIAEGKCPPKKG